jgi:hypothetical protein
MHPTPNFPALVDDSDTPIGSPVHCVCGRYLGVHTDFHAFEGHPRLIKCDVGKEDGSQGCKSYTFLDANGKTLRILQKGTLEHQAFRRGLGKVSRIENPYKKLDALTRLFKSFALSSHDGEIILPS